MSAPSQRSPEARLLVVDDEPNIRELLSASLRYAGFEVATAADGQQALTLAASFRPDLLVLDVLSAAERLLAATGDAVALCPTYGEGAAR